MSAILDAVNRQMDESVFNNTSNTAKLRIASHCDFFKKAVIITAIAIPIFAFYLPNVFGVIVCLSVGVVAYDLFNMADNLGDAAKIAAEGLDLVPSSNIEALLDGTLTGWLARRYLGNFQEQEYTQTTSKIGF